jgi:hypothetical protein
LRSQIESGLAGRINAPFSPCDSKAEQKAPAGNPEVNLLASGLPRGAIAEICGVTSSGRTSLLLAAIASGTLGGEVCALIDGSDTFDPFSASAAGVQLDHLLWVRCQNIDQALRATDLVLHAGGFGLVALDLGDIAPETVNYVSPSVWFRFRRAVEHTPTIFLVLEQEPHAKSCASLVLRMEPEGAHWSKAADAQRGFILSQPHACLFSGSHLRAKVVRSRRQVSMLNFSASAVKLESA